MKQYQINVYQNITYQVVVEAEDEASAKTMLLSGEINLSYKDVVNEDYDYMTVEEIC